MLKNWYERYLKQKFLIRLLLTYTLIVVVIILLFSLTIIRNMSQSAETDAVNSQTLAVQRTANYFEQKEATVKLLIQQLYLNPVQSQDMMDFLSTEINTFSDTDFSKANLIKYYLDSAAFQDEDIMDAIIYKKIENKLYVHSNYYALRNDDYLRNNRQLLGNMDDGFRGLALTPTYLQTYSSLPRKNIFTIAGNIRGGAGTPTFDRSIAILSINFNTDRIAELLSDLKDGAYNSQLLVLNADGEVVIDTSNRYYGQPYPYFDRVQETNPNAKLEERSIVNTIRTDKLGYYVVGILPHSDIAEKNRSTRNTIVFIALLSVMVAILLGIVSIRFLSRRIKFINKAIQKVQVGDFTYRIPIDKTNDEISNIAVNFNQMCDWIVNYIEKSYLSELKRKDAQLFALQSQIDPHFLYNTLEIIRMEALSTGNEQVSHMIEILSQLFRNSIKGGRYVTIQEELNFCKYYLELYNMRYADILSIEYEIEKEIQQFGIMKHLLQPILENYAVHGIKHDYANNQLLVKGYLFEGDIYIEISDNGKGMDEERLEAMRKVLTRNELPDNKQSIGISNVNQRIRLTFGPEYGVNIRSRQGEGTTITLHFPSRTTEELIEDAQSDYRG